MRLSLEGLSLALMAAVLATYAAATRSLELLALSLSLALILARGLEISRRISGSSGGLEVSRIVERPYVEEGEEVEVWVEVFNGSGETIHRVEVEDRVPEPALVAGPGPRASFSSPPSARARASYRLLLRSPGRYELRGVEITVKDPLGLFMEKRSVDVYSEIAAVPRPRPVDGAERALSRAPGAVLRGQGVGGLYDFQGVRDYRPGDEARRILWKVLARSGRLVVREDLGEVRARALVVVDIPVDAWRVGRPPASLAEETARASRGILEALLSTHSTVDLVMCDGLSAKLVKGISVRRAERMYTAYSNLRAMGGCESSQILYATMRGLELGRMDLVVLVTSTLALAQAEPLELLSALSRAGEKVYVVIKTAGGRLEGEEELISAVLPLFESAGWEVLEIL